MPEQDPLSDFLGGLAEKIKLAKEHKDIMEAVYSSTSATEIVKEQEDPFVGFLKKVGETVSSKLPQKPVVQITEIVEPQPNNEDKATKELGRKIKDAIEKAKNQPSVSKEIEIIPIQPVQYAQNEEVPEDKQEINDKPVEVPSTQDIVAVKTLAQKIKDAIEKAKNKALEPVSSQQPREEDEQVTAYIGELEKIKDTGTAVQKEEANSTLKELKEYIDKTVRDYSRRILDLGGGGGSVAVQYANGGTMNGDLNINGHILSGGKDISSYFGQGGGGGGDLNVNTVVYTNSAKWDDTYTTVNTYSSVWSTGLQDLSFNEATSELSITNGNTVGLSSLKNDLSEIANTSAYWADTRYNVTFGQNVTINGNLTALGSSTFKNTIFTTTSALSVVNLGPGPALYVYQGSGPYDVASFYDGDGIEVLHVGNSNVGGTGRVGINESFPTVELTVNGQISANNIITALDGNSDQWNIAYTNLVVNSAAYLSGVDISLLASTSSNWDSTYTTTNQNSANWSSTYSTYNSMSATYVPESLAIAYAVAL